MTVSEISALLRRELTPRFGAGEARAMERVIFEDLLNMKPVDVAVNPDRSMPDFVDAKIRSVVARLLGGEPLQYILGRARFCGMELEVTPDVLIPRPETEELVDMIVRRHGDATDLRVLDLGTGSGCIALALARALRFPQVTAVDVSPAALEVARRNARRLGAEINFVEADMRRLALPGPWDVIVSNPPYVMEKEKADMEPQVADHEPARALFVADDDPMEFYDAILAYARRVGARSVYFEINPLCSHMFVGAEILRDAQGKQRFAIYDPFGKDSDGR